MIVKESKIIKKPIVIDPNLHIQQLVVNRCSHSNHYNYGYSQERCNDLCNLILKYHSENKKISEATYKIFN